MKFCRVQQSYDQPDTEKSKQMKTTLRKTAALMAAAILVGSLAACGSDDESSAGADGLTKVKVGILPAVDLAPVFLGIDKGYFEDEGIEIETQVLDSGPAIAAAVLAGDAQIGFSNPVSLLIGRSRDLPLTLVAPAAADGDKESNSSASIFVKKNSDVKSLKDLVGKTIAVNALDNILGVTLFNALEKEGLDPDSVKLVEVPFPEMPAAVETGQVDAGFGVEPFVTQAVASGARRVAYPYLITAPNLPSAYYFSTDQYVDGNADAVKAFQAGLARATEYAVAHDDEMRQTVTEYTKIEPDIVSTMRFPAFQTEIDPSKFQLFLDLSKRYGLLEGEVSSEDMLRGTNIE